MQYINRAFRFYFQRDISFFSENIINTIILILNLILMKQVLNSVAIFKTADAVFQALAFVAMLLVTTQTSFGPFGLYILAIAQCLSCIVWSLYFTGDTPRYRGATVIRKTFLIVLALLLLSAFDGGAFIGLSYLMLLLGPVLGVAYFVITIQEIKYYQKARKPYYLL